MDEPEVTVKSATVGEAEEQNDWAEAVGAEGIPGAPGCALTTWLPVDATQLPVNVLLT